MKYATVCALISRKKICIKQQGRFACAPWYYKVDKLQVLDGLIPSDTHLPACFSYSHPFLLSQAEFLCVYVMPSFFALHPHIFS